MSLGDEDKRAEVRMDYLHRHYALFTTLTNAMHGFFLVAATLAVAGYAALLTGDTIPARVAALALALVGASLSWWFRKVDQRSRALMKEIENDLTAIEARIYDPGVHGFLTRKEAAKAATKPTTFRMLFNAIYWTFIVLFGACALLALVATVLPGDASDGLRIEVSAPT